MTWHLRAAAVGLALALSISAAEAKPHHHHHHRHHGHSHQSADPRPHAWCGWYMRHLLGVSDRAGNLARWWAHFGSPAGGPAVGAIVVWPHHVGLITGHNSAGWVVKSGNDSRRVRERVRDVSRAIAFRWPNQRYASR